MVICDDMIYLLLARRTVFFPQMCAYAWVLRFNRVVQGCFFPRQKLKWKLPGTGNHQETFWKFTRFTEQRLRRFVNHQTHNSVAWNV